MMKSINIMHVETIANAMFVQFKAALEVFAAEYTPSMPPITILNKKSK